MSNWCTWLTCHGEVHTTGADGCMVCLGHQWERLTACPRCVKEVLDEFDAAGRADLDRLRGCVLLPSKTRRTGQCPRCLERFSVGRFTPQLKPYEFDVWYSQLVDGRATGRLRMLGYTLHDAQLKAWAYSPHVTRVRP